MNQVVRRCAPLLALAASALLAPAALAQTVPNDVYAPNGPQAPNTGVLSATSGGLPNVLTCANGASSIQRGANPLPSANPSTVSACPVPTALSADLDSRVRDIRINSVALNGIAYARVILPKGYYDAANSAKQYPILWLLTGRGAGYQSWTCNTLVQNYVKDTDVIVVMPDASRKYDPCAPSDTISSSAIPGWYANWYQRSLDNNPERWEQFHLVELKAILEARFRTNKNYAVAGLSMGGYGAMYYATRTLPSTSTKIFKAAASYSGPINTISNTGFAAINTSMIAAGQSTDAVWGFYPGTQGAQWFGTQWPYHNPKDLISSAFVTAPNTLSTIPLWISVGDGYQGRLETSYDAGAGAIELLTRYANEDFITQTVTANGGASRPANITYLPHPGTHSWVNWDSALCRSLPTVLNAILPTSTPFVQPAGLACNYL